MLDKRYAVFTWSNYHPAGGLNDLSLSTDSPQDVMDLYNTSMEDEFGADGFQIYDTHNHEKLTLEKPFYRTHHDSLMEFLKIL